MCELPRVNHEEITMEIEMTYPKTTKQSYYEQNVGSMDRQVRFVIGFAMIVAVLLNQPETLGVWSLVLLASIPVIASAILGWDPIYAALGKSNYVPEEESIQQKSWTYSNLGIIDRSLRLFLGAAILIDILLMGDSPMQAALALVAIPLITSAMIAWDPIYALFNLNSFAARVDAEVAEPGANEQTLAQYYEFPNPPAVGRGSMPKAA